MTGHEAEELVADLLRAQGHTVISLNWRTRWCEIDVVSRHQKTVFFTEVKYRKNRQWGEGLDYITPQKLKQMHFAAEWWLHENRWKGEAQLQAAGVSSDCEVTVVAI